MKKLLLIASTILITCTGCDTAHQILKGIENSTGTGGLSNYEIVSGLKEALSVGTQKSAEQLSATDGFFRNAVIKVLMPEEAKKVESTLRSAGFGGVVDKAILAMNRAAEEAAKGAGTIFINAVRQMSITDAVGILRGGDFAATDYFKRKTTEALTQSFRPVINDALKNTNATKYWNDLFSIYNRVSSNPVNTDLPAYVTGKAMDGIFYQVSLEEQRIRKDPAARITDILKKVFGNAAAQTGSRAQ